MPDDQFGVHVIGPQYGESIVLELPDGSVGLVDVFASRGKPSTVIRFLERRFPNLRNLRFLALTHPHADHCMGASSVLNRFAPDEFWVFSPFPANSLHDYYQALQRCGGKDEVEAALELPSGTISIELLAVAEWVRENSRHTLVRYLECNRTFRIANGRVTVHRLTPGDGCRAEFNQQLKRAGERVIDRALSERAVGNVSVDANLASGAILLEFGQTRILLASDAERPRWDAWFADPNLDDRRAVQFLKVSHHGSQTGFHESFYRDFCHVDETLVVMTPFFRGRKRLPAADGVDMIRSHSRHVYCTNRIAANETSTHVWDSLPSKLVGQSLPARWLSDCRQNPALWSIVRPELVPQAFSPAAGSSDSRLPTGWLRDCLTDEARFRLLHPSVRYRHVSPVSPTACEDCRVSAFYDNSGNLTDLDVGDAAGRLAGGS